MQVHTREDRFDLTGNNRDDVWQQGSVNVYEPALDEYHSPKMVALRAEHAARMKVGVYGELAKEFSHG